MKSPRRRPGRLFWKLFLGYAVLITVALVVCVLLILQEFKRFYAEELTEHLKAQALALRGHVQGRFVASDLDELDHTAKKVGGNEADGVRVTFVSSDGTVLGDSQADARQMENHSGRPEIRDALESGWGTSTRWSNTLAHHLKYVALRVGPAETPEGTVRVALAVRTIGERTGSFRRIIWTIAIIALLATVAFAMWLVQLWTLPIRRITSIAGRISRGDLSARARVSGSDELARLARSLNDMRDHLSRQFTTIDGQRRTLETLLNQLQEGIVVAGPDGRIVLANPAAHRLLHPDGKGQPSVIAWVGRPIEQCVPQHSLQRLLLPPISTGSQPGRYPTEDPEQGGPTPSDRSVGEVRVELPAGGGSIAVLATASDIVLPSTPTGEGDSDSDVQPHIGRILTLTDITEISRAMQIKTDFVANASHELRTPLSAIRGAIETLLDIDPSEDSESCKRFIGVIDRHSARLEAMVADLLALSRLESRAGGPTPTQVDWRGFCKDLGERWADLVEGKQLHWACEPPPDVFEVTVDPRLTRIVLDNLVDNAIKFTPAGGRITVSSSREDGDLVLVVADDGSGIPEEDRERVFERFYQVTQARSGTGSAQTELRGTGLGLAIVRHAVAAMGGTVVLTSKLGAGTRVSLTIPQEGGR